MPAARLVGAAKHGFVPPLPATSTGPPGGCVPKLVSSGSVPVGVVPNAVPVGAPPPPCAPASLMPSGPLLGAVEVEAAAAQVPDALLEAGPPTPTPAPAGAATHGVMAPVLCVVASATELRVAASASASVGAV